MSFELFVLRLKFQMFLMAQLFYEKVNKYICKRSYNLQTLRVASGNAIKTRLIKESLKVNTSEKVFAHSSLFTEI